METPSVVLTDTGELQLTSISRHCLLHAIEVLRPHQNLSILLPKSGSHKIDSFCEELQESIISKQAKKKQLAQLPEDPLLPTIEVHKFCEGAIGTLDFLVSIEKSFLTASKGNMDLDSFHRCCWKYYEMERKSEISFPKWFSRECTYRLWLIYNCVLEPELSTTLSLKTTNEVMKRVVEYCGYTWNPTYSYSTSTDIAFPDYLNAITTYFEKFKLEMSLTCEVIGDMVDEIVNGVLKTGRLTKKGHMRKNWKTRWFVLQRTVLRYYLSRDNMTLKGQLVLNGNTEVRSIPDKGKRKFCFHVTCGHTGTPFEIAADDQRTKHDWMLAIRKAIALAKILDGSSKNTEFVESLQGFYLLKYGTPQPVLQRQDSTVRKMKFQATMKAQRQRLSGRNRGPSSPVDLESSEEQDQYIEMSPAGQGNITSDDSDSDDDGRYMSMNPLSMEEKQDENYDEVTIHDTTQSLPASIPRRKSSANSISSDKPTIVVPGSDDSQEDSAPYNPVCYDEEDIKRVEGLDRKSKPPALSVPVDDEQEGSYIKVVHSQPTRKPTHTQSTLSPTTLSPTHTTKQELEESNGYDRPSNWIVKNEGSNPYLTLIHGGPMSPTSSGTTSSTTSPTLETPPVVPVHRAKSPSPVHKADRFSKSERFNFSPPAPPPRNRQLGPGTSTPNLYGSSPPPIPSRWTSDSPTISSKGIPTSSSDHAIRSMTVVSPTRQYINVREDHFKQASGPTNPPPVPSRRTSDGVKGIPTSTSEHAIRRATVMSPTAREYINFKQGSTIADNTNSKTVLPPLPPK